MDDEQNETQGMDRAQPGSDHTYVKLDENPETAREVLQEIILALRGPDGKPKSRAVALAVTKLQEARFWLGEALFGEG